MEPNWKLKVIYTDSSLEFDKACEDLSWNHCTSAPHRSATNGIAERTVRRVKKGTSAVLLQSGLDEKWWADSMECHCYLRNIQDLLSDGKTPYERRFGEPSNGPVIPFGSMVEYHPFSTKEQSRIHQFGRTVLPGKVLGYALYAGGIWKGDILDVDIEELEKMDASEIHARRLSAEEVITPQIGEQFIFPIEDGKVKLSGEDQNLRTGSPNSRRKSSRFSVKHEIISGPFSEDIIYRHHVGTREESCPIPMIYIDVTRATHTTLDVMQESRIDDYWNIDRSRDLSDSWTRFHTVYFVDRKSLLKDFHGPGGD